MTQQAHFLVFPRKIKEDYATWGKMEAGKLNVEIDLCEGRYFV